MHQRTKEKIKQRRKKSNKEKSNIAITTLKQGQKLGFKMTLCEL